MRFGRDFVFKIFELNFDVTVSHLRRFFSLSLSLSVPSSQMTRQMTLLHIAINEFRWNCSGRTRDQDELHFRFDSMFPPMILCMLRYLCVNCTREILIRRF